MTDEAPKAERQNVDPSIGLTASDVSKRIEEGKTNANADVRTRSYAQIVRSNVCTLFNLINIILAIAIFTTGSYRNLLFMAIIICNIFIGIFQEVRSKQTIDKLSVITQAKAHVIRDGNHADIALSDIVIDDVIELSRGDQVPSDCVVLSGKCSCNESLLTGESDLVHKTAGAEMYSGSFVSSGEVVAQVCAVGADNYATRINNAAKVFKKAKSGIMDALLFIIKLSTTLIIPLGILLFGKEMLLGSGDLTQAILRTSAALVGMIPQGFILLTSAVLAVSVIRLASKNVLVQDLYCVETLARVDVVCLDKTGTITTGEMAIDEVIPFGSAPITDAQRALCALDHIATEESLNETAKAVRAYASALEPGVAEGLDFADAKVVAFSSERKYSGIALASGESFVMGAAEFVLKTSPRLPDVQHIIEEQAGIRRVIVIARVDGFNDDDTLASEPIPLGLAFIKDVVRETAPQTLAYFGEQGVRVNIISGDSVNTVSNIAQSVGVPDADHCVDMSTITTQEDVERVARDCRVFGRVSPEQKKQLVLALQKQGHTVAMTGDGVNDVLALHAADCSVAMGSGSAAARNVAKLVLLDNDFSSLPHVVAEGRRSINNLQRSGALFLVKTLFNAALALLFILIQAYSYPFVTIQMSLIDAFTIGLPSFVLALEPNKDRIRGNFLRNIITKAIPGSISVVLVVVVSCIVSFALGFSQEQFSTLCVLLTVVSGLNMIVRLSIPFNPIRIAMIIVCVAGLLIGVFGFTNLFMLAPFTVDMVAVAIILAVVISVIFNILFNIAQRYEDNYLASLKEE